MQIINNTVSVYGKSGIYSGAVQVWRKRMKKIKIHSEALVASLIEIPFFQSLSRKDLEDLSEICDVETYEDGEWLIKEGSLSKKLFAILEGTVLISSKTESNKRVELATLEQGAIVGETSLFTKEPSTADVTAKGNLIVMGMSQKCFISFINSHQSAGLKMLTFIIYGLIEKLRESNKAMISEKELYVSLEDIESLKDLFPTTEDILEQ